MNRRLGQLVYAAATLHLRQHAVFRLLRRAREVQKLDSVELERRQDAALTALLDRAAASTTYYRHLIPSGREYGSALERLRAVPMLEKETVQSRLDELRSSTFHGRLVTKSTGGSTGAPVRLVKDAEGIAHEMATTWASLERYGITIGDRSARFWGTPLTTRRRVRFRLTDLAMNRIRFSAFDLDESDLQSYWDRCIRFQPRWLYGYASLIHMFAEWIERTGRDASALGISVIVPTSEPLTAAQRRKIGAVFHAPVFDEYGCGEVGAIAYGCERGRLHVMTDNVVVEVVRPDGAPAEAGELGEVVVTDLTNSAMGLIRYRLGDRAEPGNSCNCGLGFPVLERIAGRIHDVVFTPAGRRWHGEKIDYLMAQLHNEVGGFTQYQVVQRSPGELEVRLAGEGPVPPLLKARIQRYVRERLDGMFADVKRVTKIERSQSGKIWLVRNDCARDPGETSSEGRAQVG